MKTPLTLAFDVYGTLIDTHGVIVALEKHVGDKSAAFSGMWRDKQLEYSFRRGLMKKYETFAVCTSNALDFTCDYFKTPLSQKQKNVLLELYRVLPAFEDVKQGLVRSQETGFRLFAFSNGSADAIEMLLINARIRDFFLDVVSVDEIKSFKPDPDVYNHFMKRAGSDSADSWMISSNPFDVIGSVSAGMRAAWIKRSPEAIFDPWGIEPTVTVNSLSALAGQIKTYCNDNSG
jgi:2-haloacid dehalogenase